MTAAGDGVEVSGGSYPRRAVTWSSSDAVTIQGAVFVNAGGDDGDPDWDPELDDVTAERDHLRDEVDRLRAVIESARNLCSRRCIPTEVSR